MLAEAKPELQHVKGFLAMLPFGQLVAPGEMKLRPAQAFWIFGGEYLGHRAIRPDQPAAGDLEIRPLQPGDATDAGHAVDHHLAGIAKRFGDQRDTKIGPVSGAGEPMHPFCTRPCLAGAATAEQQPAAPTPRRRPLVIATGDLPVLDGEIFRGKRIEDGIAIGIARHPASPRRQRRTGTSRLA